MTWYRSACGRPNCGRKCSRVGECAPGERAVDDRDAIGAVAIARVERAAGDDRDFQRREVSVSDDPVIGRGLAAGFRRRCTVDDVARAAVVGAERQHVDEAGRVHAGHARHGLGGVLEEAPLRLLVLVAVFRQRDGQRQHAIGIEPRVDLLQLRERADEQSGRHEQHERQCHFANHQRRAETPVSRSRRAVAA